jgi:hypothetical protein
MREHIYAAFDLALALEILAIEQYKIIKQNRCKANEDNRFIGIYTGHDVCCVFMHE